MAQKKPVTTESPEEETQLSDEREMISEIDRAKADNIRLRNDLATERVRTALSQKETIEAIHRNLLLELTMKYKLKDGDLIEEDGHIVRNQ